MTLRRQPETDHPASVYALLRALRAATLPRNRHFELHETAPAKAARRLNRFLRGVERDVKRADSVRVTRVDGEFELDLQFPSVRLRRRIRLQPALYELLLDDVECRRRVESGADDAATPLLARKTG